MLSRTLNGDVPTIVKSPKFQRWIKLQRLTCIASHLRHRFQRFFHIQVSLTVTNIIESSNLSVVLKKKTCTSVASFVRLFNVTQIIYIENRRHHNLRVSLLDYRNCNNNHRFMNCEHTTGMLEYHDRDRVWHWLSNEDYMHMNFKLK